MDVSGADVSGGASGGISGVWSVSDMVKRMMEGTCKKIEKVIIRLIDNANYSFYLSHISI